MIQNRCKSARTSTKYCSVNMKLGPKITWHILNLIAQLLGLHLVYQWCHLCKMGSRKEKIKSQVAVSGYADIFSVKADLRLSTILCPTGVTTWMNFSSVFLQKCISSPKYRFRDCRWRGCHKMPDQSKPPLKVDQSCWNFHRKLSLYQGLNLYWSSQLEGHIRSFSSGVWGPLASPMRDMSSISQYCQSI